MNNTAFSEKEFYKQAKRNSSHFNTGKKLLIWDSLKI